mgnify:FL=1
MTKVGLVITNHYSQKLRPYGRDLLDNALKSFINYANFDYDIIIIDNQSDNKLKFDSHDNIHC